ncbi:oxidoreductase [Streptomyces inusitatus]|uniref:Oxidoreductase n=1 Tax=Streptomyces inusitatus TaxID=68221 RepID=A0A918PPT1_9ACTN|nr:NAD(P)-binding domain-containing protein [Streptomyces inusitatus]GGZ16896.1 oxidoreductase [Streptomyces inusitatus]
MTNIGFIGTGNVARAVAAKAAAVGHDVVLGSRAPGDREGLGLPVVSVGDAIAHGDIVVNATPGTESLALLAPFASALQGKILLDIAVGLTADLGLAHPNSSVAEELQEALPGTPVVKTLCTMDAAVMVEPDRLTGPSTVFLSGDDAGAKARVGRLLGDFGWPEDSRTDLGGIATARGQEHLALLFIGVAGALGSHVFNFRLVPDAPGRRTG